MTTGAVDKSLIGIAAFPTARSRAGETIAEIRSHIRLVGVVIDTDCLRPGASLFQRLCNDESDELAPVIDLVIVEGRTRFTHRAVLFMRDLPVDALYFVAVMEDLNHARHFLCS